VINHPVTNPVIGYIARGRDLTTEAETIASFAILPPLAGLAAVDNRNKCPSGLELPNTRDKAKTEVLLD